MSILKHTVLIHELFEMSNGDIKTEMLEILPFLHSGEQYTKRLDKLTKCLQKRMAPQKFDSFYGAFVKTRSRIKKQLRSDENTLKVEQCIKQLHEMIDNGGIDFEAFTNVVYSLQHRLLYSVAVEVLNSFLARCADPACNQFLLETIKTIS